MQRRKRRQRRRKVAANMRVKPPLSPGDEKSLVPDAWAMLRRLSECRQAPKPPNAAAFEL
jgi:hypothetical protein